MHIEGTGGFGLPDVIDPPGEDEEDDDKSSNYQSDVFQISFQMLPIFDPYYYGESAQESYTGFSWSGDFGGGSPWDLIGLLNEFFMGYRPTHYRNNTPYDQLISVSYVTTYQNIPEIDAQKTVTVMDLEIQNNSSTIDSVIHYTVSIDGTNQNFVISTSAAPNRVVNVDLPSNRDISQKGWNISITAFTGCTGPCIRSPNSPDYRGYINFNFAP